jgi:hypothetical protein
VPSPWRKRILFSVLNSGDLSDCSKYRGLTLLPTITKLLTHLLLQRVRPHVQLNDHQYVFGGGAVLQMPSLLWVQRGELTCLASLDWSKAHNRVMHHACLDRLAHKDVSGKMWRLIDALYQQ